MSRLDRLFTLLSSSSSSASSRNLAAKQLGELQKSHPEELHSLLSRLHPLILSDRWETRISAVSALTSILKEVEPFNPPLFLKDENEVIIDESKFDLDELLKNSKKISLGASKGKEFDPCTSNTSTEEQKKMVNAKLGLDVAAKLGVISEDLVTNADLDHNNTQLSARQKNLLRRKNKKKDSQNPCSSKKLKVEVKADYYALTYEEKSTLNGWPFQKFCTLLLRDLDSTNWTSRHGAGTALREILFWHGSMTALTITGHIDYLNETTLKLLSVLARDRFGDFVSDQVVAPVRETCCMALGSVLKHMSCSQVKLVLKVLLQLLNNQDDWQARHGGMLGLKYLLASSNDKMNNEMLDLVFQKLLEGLKDPMDDVVGAAASAFIPIVDNMGYFNAIGYQMLNDLLWESIKEMDDLTSSTQSTMKLLAEISKREGVLESKVPLKHLVPRLVPFLSHTSSSVRQAALKSLVVLSQNSKEKEDFLSDNCSCLLSHLYQRALIEDVDDNVDLITSAFKSICSNSQLGPLLNAVCPLYLSWLNLITKPPHWPLQSQLLLNVKPEELCYLGGHRAQHCTDEVRKQCLTFKSRHVAAQLLGFLAGYVIKPVPGIDYSKETKSPSELFNEKIILSHLNTKSAYKIMSVCLLLNSWTEHHQEQALREAPESLKAKLMDLLLNNILEYEEVSKSFALLQTDASDLLATLKHYKITVLLEVTLVPDKPSLVEMEALTTYKLEEVCRSTKMKPSRIETLISRQNDIRQRLALLHKDMTNLSQMTCVTVAGACVGLSIVPEKLNPLIKPLMETIKKENITELQQWACKMLAQLLKKLCNKSPAEKVARNLIHFAATSDPIIHSDGAKIVSICKENGKNDGFLQVQNRGSRMALQAVVEEFGQDITQKPPGFWSRVVGSFQMMHHDVNNDLIQYMVALETIVPVLDEKLIKSQVEQTLGCLCDLLGQKEMAVRHMAARCLAQMALVLGHKVISAVMDLVLPLLEAKGEEKRQGAVEAIYCIVNKMGVDVVPYIVLLVVPVLGRMSDQNEDVRLLATNTFATLIKLIPLDSSSEEDKKLQLPPALAARKAKERQFVDELTNVKNLQDYPIPVQVNAELRSYQMDGIKWLAFLNRYKLHGILCDDMGLGKTLQTICILASDHFLRSRKFQSKRSADNFPLPSLVICPATLCHHWHSEILKFVTDLSPFIYNGNLQVRMGLRHFMSKRIGESDNTVVVTSYEIVRNDVEFFGQFNWNYLVLDEGHAIRNAKAKTTLAIKSLKANHRLILSGTPIQNSVLELWSLFDFLMPGFLGTEKQFNTRYTKPIVGSRSGAKDQQEAGVLALDALHRQVLPFVLRRMKGEVLKDLPPKITQDYYCDLSPIQVVLYEDFAKDKNEVVKNGDRPHVFQALQYLRKVCNHPKLVLHPNHKAYSQVMQMTEDVDDLQHACKLPALQQLLLECGIGGNAENLLVGQHRALVFCQFKAMLDIVEEDLLKKNMPSVAYLRLDGSVPPNDRHAIVDRFNGDVTIDVLLLSTSVGGLGLNLTGADTVIFVEHDWNPMKDLQAMDRAHRIGQKKVVNVYRLITRNTVEEKILGLQKFKLKTANTVISSDNASLGSMATEQLFDLFSLEEPCSKESNKSKNEEGKKVGLKNLLENLPELWEDKEYSDEYDLSNYHK